MERLHKCVFLSLCVCVCVCVLLSSSFAVSGSQLQCHHIPWLQTLAGRGLSKACASQSSRPNSQRV